MKVGALSGPRLRGAPLGVPTPIIAIGLELRWAAAINAPRNAGHHQSMRWKVDRHRQDRQSRHGGINRLRQQRHVQRKAGDAIGFIPAAIGWRRNRDRRALPGGDGLALMLKAV